MARTPVNNRPTRKTLVTGDTLPKLSTDFRPIPLGRDEDGENDSAVRAFAVLARNRSDSAVYVREGPTDDANKLDSGESYQIWEPNGVNSIEVRGTNGGERVEFRTLEAHNDFDITDKIDAFARALSHFFGTSTRNTSITAIGDTITIDDITSVSTTFDVAGTVDIGQFTDTVTIDDITSTSTTFDVQGNVDASGSDITIGDITGQTTTLDIDGSVDASGSTVDVDTLTSISDTLTIDDITGASINFAGDITDIDIGNQTDDLSASVREGQTELLEYDGTYSAGYYDSSLGTIIADYYHKELRSNATYDGRLERLEFRVYGTNTPANQIGIQVQIDYGSTGSWEVVSPRETWRGVLAAKIGHEAATPTYYPEGEVIVVWEPDTPITWESGDSVGIEVGPHGITAGDGAYDIEIQASITDIVTK